MTLFMMQTNCSTTKLVNRVFEASVVHAIAITMSPMVSHRTGFALGRFGAHKLLQQHTSCWLPTRYSSSSSRGQHVVAVAAIITRDDNKVLAMRRSLNSEAGPGLWETLRFFFSCLVFFIK
jgi:hypothetical protein